MLGKRFERVRNAVAGGDRAAFAELWQSTQPMLVRYLRVMAGDLAEDVASETWLKVIPGLASFTGDEQGFRRWLIAIARNVYVDHLRRSSRRPENVVGDVETLPVRPGLSAPDPADVVIDRLTTDTAIRLIATLPRDQAELVMLRVVVGLDVAEVAAIVGRSRGAVRVAVHRALRRLEQALLASPAVICAGAAAPQGPGL